MISDELFAYGARLRYIRIQSQIVSGTINTMLYSFDSISIYRVSYMYLGINFLASTSDLLYTGMRSLYKRRFLDSPVARAALQNSGWLMLDKVVRIGAGLSVGVWMAREFGPELFGDINYAMAFVALFSPLASMGVESVIIRDLVRYPERSQEMLGTVAFLGVSLQQSL